MIIFLGASFNERTSYVWNLELLKGKRIAQIDNDAEQLDKVFIADDTIQGDIKAVLDAALTDIRQTQVEKKDISHILNEYRELESKTSERDYSQFKSRFSLVERFFSALEETFPRGIQIFDDNIIFAQNFFNVSTGNRYYPNSGISSLGHAVTAAIGARFAVDNPV